MAFASLNVKRSKTGFVKAADRGIRSRVVAMVAASGPNGVTVDTRVSERTPEGKPVPPVATDIVACWGTDASGSAIGTVHKVGECMRILASDDYGYPVEVLTDPASKGRTRYRFAESVTPTPSGSAPASTVVVTPGSAPAAPDAAAAAAADDNADAVRVDAILATDNPLESFADSDSDAVRVAVYGRSALLADSPKVFIKESVPAALRGAVREWIKVNATK